MTIYLITEPSPVCHANRLWVVAAESEQDAKNMIPDLVVRGCTIAYICRQQTEYTQPTIIMFYDEL